LRGGLGLASQAVVAALALSVAWWGLRPWLSPQPGTLFAQAAAVGVVCLLALAVWLRPWRVGEIATPAHIPQS